MTEQSTASTRSPTPLPRMSANGSAPQLRSGRGKRARWRPTRISSLYVGLVVAAAILVLIVVFLIQNARLVQVSFLGAHLRVSLAVAMLIAAVAGALVVGAAGTARITQLHRSTRRRVLRGDETR